LGQGKLRGSEKSQEEAREPFSRIADRIPLRSMHPGKWKITPGKLHR
jgi:hypothetical protein